MLDCSYDFHSKDISKKIEIESKNHLANRTAKVKMVLSNLLTIKIVLRSRNFNLKYLSMRLALQEL